MDIGVRGHSSRFVAPPVGQEPWWELERATTPRHSLAENNAMGLLTRKNAAKIKTAHVSQYIFLKN